MKIILTWVSVSKVGRKLPAFSSKLVFIDFQPHMLKIIYNYSICKDYIVFEGFYIHGNYQYENVCPTYLTFKVFTVVCFRNLQSFDNV